MSNGQETKKAIPPYIPYATFRSFVSSLSQGVPSRIDSSLLRSMSGTAQGQLISALKYLRLIDANGNTQHTLEQLASLTGDERQAVYRDILTTAYPFLVNDFNLAKATVGQLEERFRSVGASGDTVRKCTTFFIAAAGEADLPISPFIAKASRPRRTAASTRSNGRKAKPQRPNRPNPSADNEDERADIGQGRTATRPQTWAELLLAKFPSFDPAWPDEVKARWFDGFQELMSMGNDAQAEDDLEEPGEGE